LNSLEV